MKALTRWFGRKDNTIEDELSIGKPDGVTHNVHVTHNKETDSFEGIPPAWLKCLGSDLSQAEMDNNPQAAISAVKFLKYSIKRKDTAVKPIATPEVIQEEADAIENIFENGKDPDDPSEGNQYPPDVSVLPAITNKDVQETKVENKASPVSVRRKPELLSDDELMEKFRKQCSPLNPESVYDRDEELGAGARWSLLFVDSHFDHPTRGAVAAGKASTTLLPEGHGTPDCHSTKMQHKPLAK